MRFAAYAGKNDRRFPHWLPIDDTTVLVISSDMKPTNRILFLCTGNYYRSRYAEELFNHAARNAGLAWNAFSRGLAESSSPENVGPMSRFALDALRAKNILPEGATRYPQCCTLADFDTARLVIALKEAEHRPLLEQRFPEMATRVRFWHVDDIEQAHPTDALAKIDDYIDDLILTLREPTARR